jgi:DHA1 family tetracycline resistance protein-like MFS transporter
MIVQGVLVKPLVARFGERATLLAGLTCGIIGFTAYSLVPEGWMIWLFTPVLACMGIFGPSVQALMSRRVQPHEQGKLQGANASILGITGMVGPALFTQSFSRSITPGGPVHWPGTPFFLAGLLVFSALVLASRVTR